MAHKSIFPLILCSILLLVITTGCSAVKKSSRSDPYGAQKNEITVQEQRAKKMAKLLVLSENSTLSDYLAYAALHNPGLEAAFNRWKASLEKVPQVTSLPDPRFTYAFYIEEVETRVGPQRHKIDISQVFPWFGKLELRGDIVLEEAKSKREMFEFMKLKLFFTVKEAYYDYYYLSQSISITEENMKLLGYFESVARTKYSAGKASNADVIKAQVELGKLEERLLSLRELREPLIAKLNTVMNRPFDADVPWPSAVPDVEISLTDDDIIGLIQEHNPELKSLEFTTSQHMKALELAKKQFYPDIMAGMSYIATDTSSMPGTVDSGKDPVMAMISLNLPLRRNKYHAAVREMELRKKVTEKERENRQNTLISDMKTTLYNFRDAGRKVELYRDTLIPKALQSLNVTQTAFEAGRKDFLSLMDTQRTLLELELAHEKALINRAKNRARIEMIIGKNL